MEESEKANESNQNKRMDYLRVVFMIIAIALLSLLVWHVNSVSFKEAILAEKNMNIIDAAEKCRKETLQRMPLTPSCELKIGELVVINYGTVGNYTFIFPTLK